MHTAGDARPHKEFATTAGGRGRVCASVCRQWPWRREVLGHGEAAGAEWEGGRRGAGKVGRSGKNGKMRKPYIHLLELADFELFFFSFFSDDACLTEPVLGLASAPKPSNSSAFLAFFAPAFFDFFFSPDSAAAARVATSALADFFASRSAFRFALASGELSLSSPSLDLLDAFLVDDFFAPPFLLPDFGGIFCYRTECLTRTGCAEHGGCHLQMGGRQRTRVCEKREVQRKVIMSHEGEGRCDANNVRFACKIANSGNHKRR